MGRGDHAQRGGWGELSARAALSVSSILTSGEKSLPPEDHKAYGQMARCPARNIPVTRKMLYDHNTLS